MLELLNSRRLRLAETLILAVLRARSIEVAPARQIGSEHRISKSALCNNAYETPPYHTRYGGVFSNAIKSIQMDYPYPLIRWIFAPQKCFLRNPICKIAQIFCGFFSFQSRNSAACAKFPPDFCTICCFRRFLTESMTENL